MQGFHMSAGTFKHRNKKRLTPTEEAYELSADKKNVLDELLDYCGSLNKEVLFIAAPFAEGKYTYDIQRDNNATIDYIRAKGFTVLDCNADEILDELNFDYSTDFINALHTNYLGAQKYTDFLSEYLKNHYELPDRRGDDAYEPWERGYEYYVRYVKERTS